jgi:pseudaminic acid biosynthesis-associated methylase
MTAPESPEAAEARRLEGLWASEFGDAYIARNPVLHELRAPFWASLIGDHDIASVLEVGCGQGGNLMRILPLLDPTRIWGVDVNPNAVELARRNTPGANIVLNAARALPFPDRFVDLVFTVTVLIHQPDETLPQVMDEIVRCADRFVLWCEYYASSTEEVPYHGEPGTLFKRDFAALYAGRFPELTVVDEGYLAQDEGFDRSHWQLLERSSR